MLEGRMAAAAPPREKLPPLDRVVLVVLVAAKVSVHIPGLYRYGYFRDELYFLDHWLWGPPDFNGDLVIWLQWSRESLEPICGSVEQVGEHHHPWGMAEENRPIFLCRGPIASAAEAWPELKQWN